MKAAIEKLKARIEKIRDRIRGIRKRREHPDVGLIIDVSEHNGNINWKDVAGEVTHAFIRATYGATDTDGMFTAARVRESNAELRGNVGFYHYAYPGQGDARAECQNFIQSVKSRGGTFRQIKIGDVSVANGVLDFEEPGSADWIREWVDEFEKVTGMKPTLYGGAVLRELNPKTTFGCKLWLAAYVSNPDPYVPQAWREAGWTLWQFSSTGRAPGVNGNVDLNRVRSAK